LKKGVRVHNVIVSIALKVAVSIITGEV